MTSAANSTTPSSSLIPTGTQPGYQILFKKDLNEYRLAGVRVIQPDAQYSEGVGGSNRRGDQIIEELVAEKQWTIFCVMVVDRGATGTKPGDEARVQVTVVKFAP